MVTSVKTICTSPSFSNWICAPYPTIYPAFSSRFTRIRHGLGESPTASASSTFVMRPFFCNCERMRRSMRSSLPSLLIVRLSLQLRGIVSTLSFDLADLILSRSYVGFHLDFDAGFGSARGLVQLQRCTDFGFGEHVVECLLKALEHQVELCFRIAEGGRKTQDVVAESAEHQAVPIGGCRDPVGQMKRCVEALPGFLVRDKFKRAEQSAMT